MPVSLAERLRESIRREGPITFRDWMNASLYDPVEGYYQRSDLKRWGREGDYRTSPERSELFAASFARYFAKLYDELQQPEEWTIIEGGGGDGRFAAGVLRTLADQFPSVFAATRYRIQEVSNDARRRAEETLSKFKFRERVQFGPDLKVASGIYFSNELLDAFPVHRVAQNRGVLSELYVAVDSNDRFVWLNGPLSTERLSEFCRAHSVELAEGQVIEINLGIDDWLSQVAGKLSNGFLITVDYGAEASELYDSAQRPNGTLRGFSRHGFVDDLLAQPGEYDITSSVNWTQVKTVGERLGFEVFEFLSQDKFLMKVGLLDELELQLRKAETEAEKVSWTTGAREMILPGGMGSNFQVLVQKLAEEEDGDVA